MAEPECDFAYQFISKMVLEDCRPGAFRVAFGNQVYENIAANFVVGAGYITDGDDCDEAVEANWRENVVHSSRDGVLVFNQPADYNWRWPRFSGRCRLVRGVMGYDCNDHGVVAWYITSDLLVRGVQMIHNQIGFTAIVMAEKKGTTADTINPSNHLVQVQNSTFAGRWSRRGRGDCSLLGQDMTLGCTFTLLNSKPWCETFASHAPFMHAIGIMESVFVFQFDGETGRTKGEHKFIWHEPDSYGTLRGKVHVDGVHFANFNGLDECGQKSVAFYNNPYSNDTFKQHSFSRISWENIENGGEFYARNMYGMIPGHFTVGEQSVWLDYDNIKFGAYWPDAPKKVWVVDVDGTFTGSGSATNLLSSETSVRSANFSELVGNPPTAAEGWNGRGLATVVAGDTLPLKAGCIRRQHWNALQCDQQLVTLAIEHLGGDQLTRRAGPVVLCKGDGMMARNG